MKKKILSLVLAIVLIICAFATLSACGRKLKDREITPTIEDIWQDYTGTVYAEVGNLGDYLKDKDAGKQMHFSINGVVPWIFLAGVRGKSGKLHLRFSLYEKRRRKNNRISDRRRGVAYSAGDDYKRIRPHTGKLLLQAERRIRAKDIYVEIETAKCAFLVSTY